MRYIDQNAMNSLINTNKESSIFFEKAKEEIDCIAWCKEFNTISINTGRRTGKTKFIADNATKNDIIYTVLPIDAFPSTKGIVFNYSYPRFDNIKNIERIFIDEPFHASLDCIYTLHAKYYPQFILIGDTNK